MATMNSISSSNPEEQEDLESIFKQKRILRTQVRKTLKSMDPSLRSHEAVDVIKEKLSSCYTSFPATQTHSTTFEHACIIFSIHDNVIENIVLEAPWFKSSRRLCAYISCSALREVDTSKLLSEILQTPAKDDDMEMRKKLYVPHVEDKNSHMRMFHISSIDDLIANSMNILEPAPVDADGNEREDVMQANEPVDLFLLPGLAFDRSGRRLGRGGGYYDTFLKKYQELAKERNWGQPLLVALSYSLQIMDEAIPVTPKDMLVDALVSPSGVLRISPAALDRMQL